MNPRIFALTSGLVLALAACGSGSNLGGSSSGGGGEAKTSAFAQQFADIPRPSGATMDPDRTLVFGSSEAWIGRLVINASGNPNNMFDFYKQEMPNLGWTEITSILSATSVLTYSRQGRVATIQIQGRTLMGSEVSITVSPEKSGGSGAMAPAPMAAPVAPVRGGGVQSAPLSSPGR